MQKKIDLGEHSKVKVKWNVSPIDYTHELEDKIKTDFAKKYAISKDKVTVEPNFVNKNENGVIDAFANTNTQDIQKPEFQQTLFKKYIEEKDVKDYDFDKIIEIDNLINANINYEVYDKHKKYSFKWIKWSNFMSFGEDNFFDFTTLKGLVLVQSDPANQGGKTTFCLDLLRFLLFGKVTSRQDNWTLSNAFNNHLPEATEVVVEGCITLDGEDYVIKRTLTRPSLKKRTEKSKVTQKINYYHIINNEYCLLEDDDAVEHQEESSTRETNKLIKEAIGNERDFDIMICVDSDNLKGLISLKDTDRGRLISRWIGLLPLEEKDKIAREYFNKTIIPSLLSNKYDESTLSVSISVMKEENEEFEKDKKVSEEAKKKSQKKIEDFNKTKEELLQSKTQIDETLSNVDVATLENQMVQITELGKKKRLEKKANEAKLEELSSIEFDESNYKKLSDEYTEKNASLAGMREQVKYKSKEIDLLKSSEFCPTCGAKLKDVDNTEAIKEKQKEYEELVEQGKRIANEVKELLNKKNDLDTIRVKYNEKLRLELVLEKNDVDIENLLSKYKERKRILDDIEKNKTAIEKNNKIDTALNTINVNISEETRYLNNVIDQLNEINNNITSNNKLIKSYQDTIDAIHKEETLIRNWRLYLDMVGKNGISKLVLRSTLPLINGELKRLLTDVCDFYVEIVIDDRNDVTFNLIHDGVVSNLGSGSGLEQTIASLALRSVLSKISTFSKPSFVVFDEILGGVADDNYDPVKLLYDKIITDYSFIFQITHLKQIADWHNQTIIITKKDNVSTIKPQ